MKKIKRTLEKNKKDWEQIAENFSQTRKNLWLEFEDFKKYLNKNDKVLDLGCGNGRFYEFLRKRIKSYVGVDQSKSLIYRAQKEFSQARFLVANALDLPFKKNEFDLIFSIAFLHHLPSKKLRLKVLKDCFYFLKKNGYLILTVWNLYQPDLVEKYKIRKIFLGFKNVFIPFKDKEETVQRYYYAFSEKELKKLVSKAGFKIRKSYYVRKGEKTNKKKGYNLVLIAKK